MFGVDLQFCWCVLNHSSSTGLTEETEFLSLSWVGNTLALCSLAQSACFCFAFGEKSSFVFFCSVRRAAKLPALTHTPKNTRWGIRQEGRRLEGETEKSHSHPSQHSSSIRDCFTQITAVDISCFLSTHVGRTTNSSNDSKSKMNLNENFVKEILTCCNSRNISHWRTEGRPAILFSVFENLYNNCTCMFHSILSTDPLVSPCGLALNQRVAGGRKPWCSDSTRVEFDHCCCCCSAECLDGFSPVSACNLSLYRTLCQDHHVLFG